MVYARVGRTAYGLACIYVYVYNVHCAVHVCIHVCMYIMYACIRVHVVFQIDLMDFNLRKVSISYIGVLIVELSVRCVHCTLYTVQCTVYTVHCVIKIGL